MSAEEWRSVVGWPDYSVSNLGRVASHKGSEPRVITGGLVDGYRRVKLYGESGARFIAVHALVAGAFIGPRPDGQQVRHLDGDRLNNVASNLAYGTHADNMQDRLRHGRHPMASKTHCKRGHEFTPENTHLYRGSRFCLECRVIRRQVPATARAA